MGIARISHRDPGWLQTQNATHRCPIPSLTLYNSCCSNKSEVLPQLIGAKATEELFRRGRGRPPKEAHKVNQTLRLDPDVIAAYRQEGRGWQTLINTVLRENMPGHHK